MYKIHISSYLANYVGFSTPILFSNIGWTIGPQIRYLKIKRTNTTLDLGSVFLTIMAIIYIKTPLYMDWGNHGTNVFVKHIPQSEKKIQVQTETCQMKNKSLKLEF